MLKKSTNVVSKESKINSSKISSIDLNDLKKIGSEPKEVVTRIKKNLNLLVKKEILLKNFKNKGTIDLEDYRIILNPIPPLERLLIISEADRKILQNKMEKHSKVITQIQKDIIYLAKIAQKLKIPQS